MERTTSSGTGMRSLGRVRIWYPIVDSTMTVATQLARSGAPHGTVIQAGVQTAGRGRQGRPWKTAPRSALLTSWILRLPAQHGDVGALSPLIALGVVRAIRPLIPGAPIALKWPNDVLIDDRKCAGILLSSLGSPGERVVIAGIGVNLWADAIPDGVNGVALAAWTASIDADYLLDALAEQLDDVLRSFLVDGTIRTVEQREINSILAWNGGPVTLKSPDGGLAGLIRGIDQDGSLLLQAEGRDDITAIRMGEIVRGPRLSRTDS